MELPDTISSLSKPLPQIRHAPGVHLTGAEMTLLRQAFSDSQEIFVEREFRSGYSGALVLLVSPGSGQAQTVVKLGIPADLQREYIAYRQLVEPVSPQNTARLRDEPLLTENGQLALLVYTFAGGDPRLPTRSLLAYYDSHGGQATAKVLDRVFRVYGRQWWVINQPHKLVLAEQYDRLLPVHLKLKPASLVDEKTSQVSKTAEFRLTLQAGQASATILRDFQLGQLLRLCGFQVSKVRPDKGEITLTADPPPGEASAPLRLRLETDQAATYQPGDLLETLDVVVIATRQTLLAEVAATVLPSFDPTAASFNLEGRTYPNPLHDLPALLDRVIETRVSTIHGDLNLQNILVDGTTGFAWLIDFAETRQGPTLFDLQRLESQVITKLLSPVVTQAGLGFKAVTDLFEALHSDPPRPLAPHSALQEPYTVLVTIRRLARQYLMDDRDWDEYYLGLTIVLLGTLKFTELETLVHGLALMGAAVVNGLLGKQVVATAPLSLQSSTSWQWGALTIGTQTHKPLSKQSQRSSHWPSWIAFLGVGDWFKPKPKPKLEPPLALIINVQGRVEVRRKTNDRVIPAVFGMHLFFEDAIITYEAATVDLMCQDGLLFHLDKQSTLVVRCGETDDQLSLDRLPADFCQQLTNPGERPTVMAQANLVAAKQTIDQLSLSAQAQCFLRAKLYQQNGLLEEAIFELKNLASQRPESGLAQALGDVYYQAGLLDQAVTHYTTALKEAQIRADLIGQAEAYVGLGWIAKANGEVDTVKIHWQTAEMLYRREGYLTRADQIVTLIPSVKYKHTGKFWLMNDKWPKAWLKQFNLSNLVKSTNRIFKPLGEFCHSIFRLNWIKAGTSADWTRSIAVISVLFFLLLGVVSVVVYQQRQRTITEQTQIYHDTFRRSIDPNERIKSLAGLFDLSEEYAQQAEQLFYKDLSSEEQLALFKSVNPPAVGPQLVTVVRRLYADLDNNERDNTLLAAMAESLKQVEDVRAGNLATEIEQWLLGRDFFNQKDYEQAVTVYGAVIELNDRNAGVYYDRGLAYLELGEVEPSLADFETTLSLSPSRQERIAKLVSNNPRLYGLAIHQGTSSPELVALLPTPTSTPTPTPTPTFTPTSTPTPTATPTPTPTPLASSTSTPAVIQPAAPLQTVTDTPAPTPTPLPTITPTSTPKPATVVYVQSNGQSHSLGLVSSTGQVINDDLHRFAGAPAWSPNGAQIAFYGEPSINSLGGIYAQGSGIWLLELSSGSAQLLFPIDHVTDMTWSPDGSRLAFEVGSPGVTHQIFVIDAREGRRLSGFAGEQPAWSPNSQELVIKSCLPECGLWRVGFDGSGGQRLTNDSTDSYPSWSANGEYIAFASRSRHGNWEIYRLHPVSNEVVRLTHRLGTDTTPVFSPDSLEIYFRTDAFGGWQISAMAVDGSDEHPVLTGVGPSDDWGLARPAVQ